MGRRGCCAVWCGGGTRLLLLRVDVRGCFGVIGGEGEKKYHSRLERWC